MQGLEDNYQNLRHSDTELVGVDRVSLSSPLSDPLNKRGGGEKSAQLTLPDDNTISASDDYVEITLDVRDELVAIHRVNAASDDPELHQFGKGLEKKSSFELSTEKNSSSRIQQVSHELKLAFVTHRQRFDQMEATAMQAPKGLKFISKIGGGGTWAGVEKRFNELTSTTNGMLPRSLFGECIGMNKWSDKEFASNLFDSLSRRWSISCDSITKEQLKEFWDHIAGKSQFRTFFDIVDEDADGRITEDEVREVSLSLSLSHSELLKTGRLFPQIISMSASANKLYNIMEQADEYARLIMEKLDPNQFGYIMIENLEMLLLRGLNQSVEGGKESRILSQMLSQKLRPTYDHPLKRWYRDFHHFLLDNWQRVWVMALWIGVMGGIFAYSYLQYKNRVVF